mgnify:CR=1 FL=1
MYSGNRSLRNRRREGIDPVPANQVSAYELILAMNTLRVSYGLPALIEDPIVNAVAQSTAAIMAANNMSWHIGDVRGRIAAAGYGGGATVWATENFAVSSGGMGIDEILEAIERGRNAPKIEMEKAPSRTVQMRARMLAGLADALVRARCEQANIATEVLMTRAELEALLADVISDGAPVDDVRVMPSGASVFASYVWRSSQRTVSPAGVT